MLILNKNEMKLFVWEGVLTDYTSGIAFALAESVDEARKLILEKYEENNGCISDNLISDLNTEPLIIENKEGFYVYANTLLAGRCPLIEIDREVLQMCVEMYQKGEKLTAIKWLIEEAKRTEYTFGIKWAHEYFQSIGLEAVEGNDR